MLTTFIKVSGKPPEKARVSVSFSGLAGILLCWPAWYRVESIRCLCWFSLPGGLFHHFVFRNFYQFNVLVVVLLKVVHRFLQHNKKISHPSKRRTHTDRVYGCRLSCLAVIERVTTETHPNQLQGKAAAMDTFLLCKRSLYPKS